MERHKEIQRAVYAMVAVNTALLFLLVAVFLRASSHLMIVIAVCFPALVIFNFLFLRRKLRRIGPPAEEECGVAHSGRFSTYACSAIFFAGTLGGLRMITQGELPWTTLPFLVFPLSLAIYCLKVARRNSTRKPKPDNAEPNRPR
jgi:hypothetical protein